jgi:hypothetical protein
MRWAWIGLAIVSTIGYLWMSPSIVVVLLQDEEEEGRTEPKRGGEVEDLEEEEEADAVDILMDTGI